MVGSALGDARATTGQNLDAGEQLGKRVGFRQVIVAAGAQALDPVVHLAERREDEYRGFDLLFAQGADERETIELRQHAVDHQHVVIAGLGHGIAVEAVRRMVRHVARFPECLDQVGRRLLVVFDDENPHGPHCNKKMARRQTDRGGGLAVDLPGAWDTGYAGL